MAAGALLRKKTRYLEGQARQDCYKVTGEYGFVEYYVHREYSDPRLDGKYAEAEMKIIKLNDKFNLVRFTTGREVVRYRDGNPYAPENIEVRTLMGPPLNAISEQELSLARGRLNNGEGAELIGPYVVG